MQTLYHAYLERVEHEFLNKEGSERGSSIQIEDLNVENNLSANNVVCVFGAK